MALEQPLSLPGRSALLAFLKVTADGEMTCERSRQCLCEAHDFVPHEFFRVMQGSPPKGFITVRDVHSWLSDQPHRLPRMLNEDVAAFFDPYANSNGELRYEGFLKMLLPRDDPALREVALNRNATGHWTHPHDVLNGFISAETSYRVCRLFEEEIELARHLHFHRKALREQGVTPRDAFSYLASEKSAVSGIGFISQTELRLLLVERLGELTLQQCEALFRRASVISSGGITYEDVVHLLQPHGEQNLARPVSPRHLSPTGRSYRGVLDLGTSDRPLSPRLVSGYYEPRLNGLEPRLNGTSRSLPAVSASAEILSPRTLSTYRRPISPRSLETSMVSPRTLELKGLASLQGPDLQAVLAVIERQGQLDHHIEETKGFLPSNTPVEAIFGLLDSGHKGFVTDTDLWQFSQKLGRLPFSSIFALIREIQNGRYHDANFVRGQLSLREVGALVHRKGTIEHEAMDASTTDHDAKSSLYIMRFTEPCPGCGSRIQRDADATGCPNVTCPVCHRSFQCYTLMGDIGAGGQPHPVTDTDHLFHATLPSTVQQDLFRIIEAHATAADEIEGLRKQLMLTHADSLLTDTFNAISGGKHFFTFVDLRRVLFQYKYWASERELELIWHRYARSADKVTLAGYAQQLQPVMSRV
mmetsp:Transcript_146577/g.408363  ORF Transcript_146577/g.408363 Transcript_146577/m.408363 type:complete len:644 (-) Transcript_146577:209-2140(-)